MSIRIYHNNTELYETKPSASSEGFPKYYNSLYESTDSKTFETDPEHIEQVLPNNKFNFEYKGSRYVVNHDNMSQKELEQVKLDIENAHSASVEKLSINRQGDEPTVQIYIFNNQGDSEKYIDLIPQEGSLSTYQCNSMDAFLAYELSILFKFDSETAIAIGQEVVTTNYEKYIKFEEMIEFEREGVLYIVRNKSFSTTQEERDQVIKDVKDSHASLKDFYESPTGVSVIIDVDNDSDSVRRVILLKDNEATGLDSSLVKLSSKPVEEDKEPQGPQPTVASFMDTDEEPKTTEQEVSNKEKRSIDLPDDHTETDNSPQATLLSAEKDPEVALDQNREEETQGKPEEPVSPPQIAEHPTVAPISFSEENSQETQSSDVGLISSFIYILTKPLSLALSAITSVISWVFGFDEKEPDATHHDNNHALPEPSADDVPYDTSSNDIM